jgi:hypothetical protein
MMDSTSYTMYIPNSITISSLVGIILISMAAGAITINPIQAETGIGDDIFKVITTIFGVDESKGDVVAIVTAKDEEAKVKLFDASGPEVVPLNASEGGGHLIEYVATFPNLTVNSGHQYKACVATVKDLELTCKTGQNSPAARPEFVDLSLNASSNAAAQQVEVEEGAVEDGEEAGNGEDDVNVSDEESGVSPGVPPTG